MNANVKWGDQISPLLFMMHLVLKNGSPLPSFLFLPRAVSEVCFLETGLRPQWVNPVNDEVVLEFVN